MALQCHCIVPKKKTLITLENFMGEERRMKVLTVSMCFLLAVLLVWSFAFAAGDAAKGKILFDDPEFAGGTAGQSCSSCHPEGKGAAKAADKKDLRKTINSCIVNALRGKAIDPGSSEMDDMVAYLKSIRENK
jgi:mono/diheme cytochrome c family protein